MPRFRPRQECRIAFCLRSISGVRIDGRTSGRLCRPNIKRARNFGFRLEQNWGSAANPVGFALIRTSGLQETRLLPGATYQLQTDGHSIAAEAAGDGYGWQSRQVEGCREPCQLWR